MQDGKIAALILAAGYSSRMGEFKPLLPLGRSTVVGEAVERFRRAGIADVRVILGHRAGEMEPVIDALRARKIVNEEFQRGMYSSILAGVRSLEPEIEAFFVLPVDTPLIKPATIAALAEARRKSRAAIVYPRFEGLRGHPPIISRKLCTQLPEECPGGLAAFLARHEDQALDLDVIDQSIVMNCNTRQDYLRLKAYASRGEDIPTERECLEILRNRNGSETLIAHCRLVARVAKMTAVFLKLSGLALDLDLIEAGGLLHDMAKGEPDHSAAGAQLLEKMGYSRVACIVASHTDIELKNGHPPDESDVVHIADKFVRGNMLVSLEERFIGPLQKFSGRPEALRAVEKRLRNARAIQKKLESILATPLETIVRKYGRSMRTGSPGSRNIYLARHGAIGDPGDVKRYIGHSDLPLNEEGLRQAEALAEKLRGVSFSAIFCSDLRRSSDTAKMVANLQGLDISATSDFREISLGQWEGLAFEAVRRQFPAQYEERGRDIVHFRPPGGESFLDCARRAVPAFYEAIYSTRGDILIVGHAGVNRILLCQMLGKPMSELFDIEQDYCCVNRIGCSDFSCELQSCNENIFGMREGPA